MIRASQINGCSVCTDMHTKDAVHAGETSDRLNLVAAWREADGLHRRRAGRPRAHRAGHPHCRRGPAACRTRFWANAAKHYDDDQLAALVSLIAGINAYNRLNVVVRQPAGDYQPGQWSWPGGTGPAARAQTEVRRQAAVDEPGHRGDPVALHRRTRIPCRGGIWPRESGT